MTKTEDVVNFDEGDILDTSAWEGVVGKVNAKELTTQSEIENALTDVVIGSIKSDLARHLRAMAVTATLCIGGNTFDWMTWCD